MNMEQKLAYIKKAIEMGADIDVMFHNLKEKADAKEAAIELSKVGNMKHAYKNHNGTHWYKLRSEDYSLNTSIFFDEKEEEASA